MTQPSAPTAPCEDRPAHWRGALLALALLAAAPYVGTLRDGFVGDDFWFVENAASAEGWLDATRLDRRWSDFWWRPLGLLSWWLTAGLAGLEPLPHRLVNLFVHVGTALAIAGLVRRLSGSTAGALAAGALFAVHPSAVETVVWCSARYDGMAACGSVAALAAFAADLQRPSRAAKLALCAAFVLALGAKESAILIPGMAVVLGALWQGPGAWRRMLPSAALLGTLAALYLGLRWLELGGLGGFPVEPGEDPPNAWHNANLRPAVERYARAMLLPGDWLPGHRPLSWAAAGTLAAACALLLARARRPLAALRAAAVPATLCALFLLTLVGWYSPDAHDEHTRYLYLPIALLAASLGALWPADAPARWPRLRALPPLLLAATLLIWTRTTWLHTQRWTAASATVERILAELPEPDPEAEHMMIGPLPKTRNGAFVFVNGFRMAWKLSGNPRQVHLLDEEEWAELRTRADDSPLFRNNLWRWRDDGWSAR